MFSINVNPSLLRVQNILNRSNNSLAVALERITTGMRINSAKDDPAGYYVSQGLNSQIKSLKSVQNNVAIGSSMLSLTEGSLSSISSMLNRLNDLALQGASTTMTDSAREALTKEAADLVAEIKKLNKETTFNGISIFGETGSFSKAVANDESPSTAPVTPTQLTTPPTGYTAIYTAADLSNIRNNTSGKYILMNDIDLSSIANWDPISDFSGILDGNGYKVENLKIDRASTNNVGLFGRISGGTIQNLGLENVNIKGNDFTGGLTGVNNNGIITNCYVTGNISGHNDVGGLAGVASGHISNSYSKGNVTGNDNTGGLVGEFSGYGSMVNCYTTSNVKAQEGSTSTRLGILCGGGVGDCIALNVFGNSSTSTIKNAVGSGSFHSKSSNVNVLTNTQFNKSSTWSNFSSSVWDKSSTTPTLKANAEVQKVTDLCNIEISTADDLNLLNKFKDIKFTLTKDIDLSSIDNWTPIGTNASDPFKGILDGNGYKIKNLKIDRATTNNVGLFGYTSGATIENLGLENVDIKGKDYTGGIIGFSTSTTISNCYVTGSITGNSCTGGLAGNTAGGKITNCYTTSNIQKKSGATATTFGILVGKANSTTATNVFGNSSTSTIKEAIGGGTFKADSTNYKVMDNTEFSTSSTWSDFDAKIWNKSEYPPKLKKTSANGSNSSSMYPSVENYTPTNTYIYGGSNSFRIQRGLGTDTSDDAMFFDTGLDLDILEADLSTVEGCLESIYNIQSAMDFVNEKLVDVGIAQKNLETISQINTVRIENLAALHSTIVNADTAEETANYTMAMITSETASTLLTQTRYFQANMLLKMINSLG